MKRSYETSTPASAAGSPPYSQANSPPATITTVQSKPKKRALTGGAGTLALPIRSSTNIALGGSASQPKSAGGSRASPALDTISNTPLPFSPAPTPGPSNDTIPAMAGEEDEEEQEEGAGEEEEEDDYALQKRDYELGKDNLRVLMESFDETQLDRYEFYRRSGLGKANIRRLVNQVLQQNVSPNIVTVVRGLSKVFVGEIIERARALRDSDPNNVGAVDGPLTPDHLREAHRMWVNERDRGGSEKRKLFVK